MLHSLLELELLLLEMFDLVLEAWNARAVRLAKLMLMLPLKKTLRFSLAHTRWCVCATSIAVQ